MFSGLQINSSSKSHSSQSDNFHNNIDQSSTPATSISEEDSSLDTEIDFKYQDFLPNTQDYAKYRWLLDTLHIDFKGPFHFHTLQRGHFKFPSTSTSYIADIHKTFAQEQDQKELVQNLEILDPPTPSSSSESESEAEEENMADRLRISDFLPQKFHGKDGDDPRSHVLQFNDYAVLHELNDADKMVRFRCTLAGQARNWIENKNFGTFNAMKTAFVRYFTGAHSSLGSTSQFRNSKYKEGETMEKYGNRIRALAADAYEGGNPPENVLVSQFLFGLPKSMREKLASTGLNTLQELITRGQLILDMNDGIMEDSSHKEVSFVAQDIANEQVEALKSQLARQQKQFDNQIHMLADNMAAMKLENKISPNNYAYRSTKDQRQPQQHSNNWRQRSQQPLEFQYGGRRYNISTNRFNKMTKQGQARNFAKQNMRQADRNHVRFPGKCHFCGIKGHKIASCRQRQSNHGYQSQRKGAYINYMEQDF